mgnify:CR=1 FL=1
MAYSEQQVTAWMQSNPNATNEQIFRYMQDNGIAPEQVANQLGMDPAAFANEYQQTGQLVQWRDANPNAGNREIAQYMNQNGYSPEQVGQTFGIDHQVVADEYQNQMNMAGANTGLYGSENAQQAGLTSALSALNEGMDTGTGYIQRGVDQASGQYDAGAAGIGAAAQQARGDISTGFNDAQGYLDPYRQGGQQAQGSLESLSGARGQDAFNQAYTDNPYTQFLQEQGNRSVLAGAAATGGLGGGNVQKELTRFGQGLAGQGLQQQIGNLQYLTGQGANAASQSSNLAMGRGQALGGVSTNAASQQAQQGNLSGNAYMQGGQSMGNMAYGTGQQAANYGFQTGQNLAQGRTRAGEMLAGQMANTTQGLAGLANQQGQDISGVYGNYASNLAPLLTQAGLSQAQIMQILSQGQSGVNQTGSGQRAGLAGVPGTQQTQGALAGIGQLAGGIGSAMTGYSSLGL